MTLGFLIWLNGRSIRAFIKRQIGVSPSPATVSITTKRTINPQLYLIRVPHVSFASVPSRSRVYDFYIAVFRSPSEMVTPVNIFETFDEPLRSARRAPGNRVKLLFDAIKLQMPAV